MNMIEGNEVIFIGHEIYLKRAFMPFSYPHRETETYKIIVFS